jgi:hypothetical protein
MTQFKFIIMSAIVMDLHIITRVYSKRVQSNAAFILDLPRFREELFSSLELLTLGGNLAGGTVELVVVLRAHSTSHTAHWICS